ncbi:MAG: 30S ribosomal protein S19e [Candidatus Bathyarchaeia archaeon]
MPTVYDVPAAPLIKRVAEYLKENYREIAPPKWIRYSKTGTHAEQSPKDPDFWYVRCASLLRKLYIEGPIGVARLQKKYGGRSKKGNEGEHKRKGGGSTIRKPLQQLEKSGLVKTLKQGRAITKEGASILDTLAGEVLRRIEQDIPSLGKYTR